MPARFFPGQVGPYLPATSLNAKKKADFGGHKKLEFEDLAAGQRIKVTYKIATGEILNTQVLDLAPVPH